MTKLAITTGSIALLMALNGASASEPGFIMVAVGNADVLPLLDNGLAEQNTDAVTDAGAPTRITEEGKKLAAEQGTTETASAPVAAATGPAFVIGNFTVPEKEKVKRNVIGRKGVEWPYKDIPAPTAESPTPGFFVAATAKMPDPVKTMTSNAGNYNRSVATPTGEKTINVKGVDRIRKTYEYSVEFAVAAGEVNGVKGAIVYRVK